MEEQSARVLVTLSLLCVWRITHLLQAEDGPWDLLVRFRRMAGSGFVGELLDCFYCLSLWVTLLSRTLYPKLGWSNFAGTGDRAAKR